MPLQFKLRSTSPGPGQVRVLAFHTGRPLGMITLSPVVVESAARSAPAPRPARRHFAPATVRIPDLSLLILESKDQGETVLSLRLTSANPSLGFNLKPFGPIRLRLEPYGYFQGFFKDIESLPIQSVQDKAKVEQRLAAKGASLFEQLVPEDLRGILWKLRPGSPRSRCSRKSRGFPGSSASSTASRPRATRSRTGRSSARPSS